MTSLLKRFALTFLLLLPAVSLGQQIVTDTLRLSAGEPSFHLSSSFVFDSSETVLLLPSRSLRRGSEYSMNYRTGEISFRDSLLGHSKTDSVPSAIVVTYLTVPLSFKPAYSLHRVQTLRDSTGVERRTLVPESAPFAVNDLFGDNLQKSGSIIRGLTVGSNRDLTLNSGFRMQLAGKLSDEIDVVAALTDENSPIQPEGTTQTLQEVDKVFVDIKSATVGATLGDFNLQVGRDVGGEFGQLARKVQGAQGRISTIHEGGKDGGFSASVTGAVGRGKFHSLQFAGIEGNQGPYRLSGKNGERQIIVIAGSERVYFDGAQMTRGETNDYTIDYSSAEITFSSRRLVTNASRIVVDFEYSDRQYSRNLLNAEATAKVAGERATVHAVFTQESDDISAPIDFSLDDSAKAILGQSGSDRFKASRPGSSYTGRDSLGAARGQYALRDTVIGGKSYSYFIYAPGDTSAVYNVIFSSVEAMPPDSLGYSRIALGQFRVVGVGQGNYLPLQFLPVPTLLRSVDLNADVAVLSNLTIGGELALSQNDRNRLSTLDDADRNGQAYKFNIQFHPRAVKLGSSNLGDADIVYSERFVGTRFASPDRVNEVEFNRRWNFDQLAAGDETIRELSLRYQPVRVLDFQAAAGSMMRKGLFKSNRIQAEVSVIDSGLPLTHFTIEDIRSTDLSTADQSTWIRQKGMSEFQYGPVKPGLRVEAENRQLGSAIGDSLSDGSFRFLELAPRVETKEVAHMRGSAELQARSQDSVVAGVFRSSYKSLTQLYSWELRNWNDLSSTLSLSLRKTDVSALAKGRGTGNSDVILVRSTTRYTPFQRSLETDWYYEFSNQRSARLERVFVRVPKGDGNYRYLGDLNDDHVADENEFELTRFDGDYVVLLLPGETLYPVVDLKASSRIRFQPSRLFASPSGWLERGLVALSTETYVRVDERSSDPLTRNLYLLRVSTFQSDRYTIAGTKLLTQDLHIFEGQSDLSIRFRYSQRQGLVQLVSSTEHSYARERSIRIRSQLVSEIANQTDYINSIDRVASTTFSSRARDITSNALTSDFSYRPFHEWEIGFRFNGGESVDQYGGDNTTVDLNGQSLRVVYAIMGRGQIRGEVKRDEVIMARPPSDPSRVLPYELTEGLVVGKTFQWSLGAEYRITGNVQLSLNYEGRTEGGRAPVHLARAEARAFF